MIEFLLRKEEKVILFWKEWLNKEGFKNKSFLDVERTL